MEKETKGPRLPNNPCFLMNPGTMLIQSDMDLETWGEAPFHTPLPAMKSSSSSSTHSE